MINAMLWRAKLVAPLSATLQDPFIPNHAAANACIRLTSSLGELKGLEARAAGWYTRDGVGNVDVEAVQPTA